MASWYEKAVFYHIYPLGMLGAPFANTEDAAADRFPELDKWVAHMEALGCTALYIGPLFESSSHGYDTRDYKLVDRRLGTNEDFRHFTKLCHEAGIKVVVDGVFNHTGREFFAFRDIQQNREGSRYCGCAFIGCSSRSTYFPMMSVSRLTRSPAFRSPSVVTAFVCGMVETEKPSVVTAATVRLMPSMVMEPFSTI